WCEDHTRWSPESNIEAERHWGPVQAAGRGCKDFADMVGKFKSDGQATGKVAGVIIDLGESQYVTNDRDEVTVAAIDFDQDGVGWLKSGVGAKPWQRRLSSKDNLGSRSLGAQANTCLIFRRLFVPVFIKLNCRVHSRIDLLSDGNGDRRRAGIKEMPF